MLWQVTKAKEDHIPFIAANMRDVDRLEVWAMSRLSPKQALKISLAASDFAFTYWLDGEPVAMMGVARHGCLACSAAHDGMKGRRVGVPWLLATDALYRDRRGFLTISKFFSDILDDGYDRLENWACLQNSDVLRWLAFYGAQFADKPVFFNGVPFLKFWRENKNV